MIVLGKPNLKLIDEHNGYVTRWKEDKIDLVLREYRRLQVATPALFVVGYDYPNAKYREHQVNIDAAIMEDMDLKKHLFSMMHNIESVVDFQPLAILFVSPLNVVHTSGMEEMCVMISYQHRLFTTRYVYRIVHDNDGEKQLLLDKPLTLANYLGPEISVIEAIFPFSMSPS